MNRQLSRGASKNGGGGDSRDSLYEDIRPPEGGGFGGPGPTVQFAQFAGGDAAKFVGFEANPAH